MRRQPTLNSAISFVGIVAAIAICTTAVRVSAQDATPVATPVATPMASPVAGGVPCTTLFGIVAGNACVLALNGSPDAGPLDVYVDGVFLVGGASFGTLGDFVPVPAGEHQFQFVPSGAPVESAVLTTRVNLTEGIAYEISAVGSVADLGSQFLAIDTRPLQPEAARVRVVHGSPDAPAIDLAITGGVPLVADLRSGQTSDAVDLPSGTYALEVRQAGSTTILLPLPGTVLSPNTSYSFLVIGSVQGGTLGVILVPVLIPPEAAAAATPVA